jgi:hypothetical protein
MSEYVELYIDQGATFVNTININDDSTNLPQNVDGYVVTGQLRKSILSQNASANLVCSVTDAANGEITFSLDAGNTSNLKAGTYLFDLKYYDSNSGSPSTIVRLMEGIFIVSPSISK